MEKTLNTVQTPEAQNERVLPFIPGVNQTPVEPASIHELLPYSPAYSVDAFLAWAPIGRTTFNKLVKAGVIRIVKMGRKTLIPRVELEAWITRLGAMPLFPGDMAS